MRMHAQAHLGRAQASLNSPQGIHRARHPSATVQTATQAMLTIGRRGARRRRGVAAPVLAGRLRRRGEHPAEADIESEAVVEQARLLMQQRRVALTRIGSRSITGIAIEAYPYILLEAFVFKPADLMGHYIPDQVL